LNCIVATPGPPRLSDVTAEALKTAVSGVDGGPVLGVQLALDVHRPDPGVALQVKSALWACVAVSAQSDTPASNAPIHRASTVRRPSTALRPLLMPHPEQSRAGRRFPDSRPSAMIIRRLGRPQSRRTPLLGDFRQSLRKGHFPALSVTGLSHHSTRSCSPGFASRNPGDCARAWRSSPDFTSLNPGYKITTNTAACRCRRRSASCGRTRPRISRAESIAA